MPPLTTYERPSERFKNICEFDLDDILEAVEDEQKISSRETRDRVFELKRYLFLCALYPEEFATPVLLDPTWHIFITYTELYAEFANRLGGFVHHRPHTQLPPRKGLERTLTRARELYGNNHQIERLWDSGPTRCGGIYKAFS